LAARAIVFAAAQPRRELWVAGSTVRALLGNKLAPSLLDRYLARNGYAPQQTEQPVKPDRADNLAGPLPGDRGAHGSFDGEAHARSLQFLAVTHRRLVAGGVVAVAVAAFLRARH
jgi:hypothetical protein